MHVSGGEFFRFRPRLAVVIAGGQPDVLRGNRTHGGEEPAAGQAHQTGFIESSGAGSGKSLPRFALINGTEEVAGFFVKSRLLAAWADALAVYGHEHGPVRQGHDLA